jgi:hypothetical protein
MNATFRGDRTNVTVHGMQNAVPINEWRADMAGDMYVQR